MPPHVGGFVGMDTQAAQSLLSWMEENNYE